MEPIEFKRGDTFSLAILVPEDMATGSLSEYYPKAQLRRRRDSTPKGLIANLNCHWEDPVIAQRLLLHHDITDSWPIGDAELDVLFTSIDGHKIRSTTVPVKIVRGITQ